MTADPRYTQPQTYLPHIHPMELCLAMHCILASHIRQGGGCLGFCKARISRSWQDFCCREPRVCLGRSQHPDYTDKGNTWHQLTLTACMHDEKRVILTSFVGVCMIRSILLHMDIQYCICSLSVFSTKKNGAALSMVA